MKIVIRAGGVGVRLWPLSRQSAPKQFHALTGGLTMLRNTFERSLLAVASPADIFVSVSAVHLETARKQIPELPLANFIVETDVRNTGPAMCLEVAYLSSLLDPNEIIASLPSDDYISDNAFFAELLKVSADFIIKNPDYILTPAVKPAYLDTGYSYMKIGEQLLVSGEEAIYKVADVAEKPSQEYCQELIDSGEYYCHTGMYLWRLGAIKDLFSKLQPEMFSACSEAVNLMRSGSDLDLIKASYQLTEKMSIESAVTGQAPALAMSVSNRLGWSDLGKWHIIKRMLSKAGENLIRGQVLAHNSSDNLIYNTVEKKVIITNDIKGLVIVDTPDALYISSSEQSAEVKQCLEEIKEKGWTEYL